MIKFGRRDKRTKLEKEIEHLFDALEWCDPTSEDYAIIADNLDRLYKAKGNEQNRFVSPDTYAIIAGNLVGILLILGYEQINVITTKALGFVIKGRV